MKTPSIDLKSNTKATIIALLNARLADAIDLSLATKQAHWNLKGPQFIAVHEMLDLFRSGLDVHTDTMAERVAQLDGIALGTSQAVAKSTTLSAYPTDIRKVPDHLAALADRYAALANQVRQDIDTSRRSRRRRHRRHPDRPLARARQGPLVHQIPPGIGQGRSTSDTTPHPPFGHLLPQGEKEGAEALSRHPLPLRERVDQPKAETGEGFATNSRTSTRPPQ